MKKDIIIGALLTHIISHADFWVRDGVSDFRWGVISFLMFICITWFIMAIDGVKFNKLFGVDYED